jgi:hypothetical protein
MGHFAHSGNLGGITVPLEIFRDPRLKPTDILFLIALLQYRDEKTGKTNPGADAIAAITGMSHATIERARIRLVETGWVKITSGDSKTSNDYTVLIPLEAGFKYRARAVRREDGEWRALVKQRDEKIKPFVIKKVRSRNQWYAMDDDVLIAELENEKKEGVNYIPDDVLENCEIIRGGDNNYEARVKRQEARENAGNAKKETKPGGVRDCYDDEYALEDFRETSRATVDEYAGYTRDQLIDMQIQGVRLPREIIDQFNLDPSL